MVRPEMVVGGAVIEGPDGLLLVHNRRRNGATDWSPPGGVIDADDPSLLAGLAREVAEETGLVIHAWEGPLYEVRAVAPGLGWSMRCEVHRGLGFDGSLSVDDPDGIVIDAAFVPPRDFPARLALCHPWVREPLGEWLAERWGPDAWRDYSYEVRGDSRDAIEVIRTTGL